MVSNEETLLATSPLHITTVLALTCQMVGISTFVQLLLAGLHLISLTSPGLQHASL